MKGLKELVFFYPLTTKGSPLKSSGVRQSKTYKWVLAVKGLTHRELHTTVYWTKSVELSVSGIYLIQSVKGAFFCTVFIFLGDSTAWVLPFTSGGFIYIALVTIVPDLLQETRPRYHMFAFSL